MNKRALIAMSGGVDSSVATILMIEEGYECIGATMRLFRNEDIGQAPEKACCSLDDTEDARRVAYRLGMKYYVFNFSDDFKARVIDRFIYAYENGLTPNPCIDCNRYMKFEKLYQRAVILGCDFVVTGHYARIEERGGRFLLKKAIDEKKDQSYVLAFMSQEQLAHTRFPLGHLCKEETRKIASEHGLLNAQKHESQDICFAPGGDYAGIIEAQTGKTYPAGPFTDREGNSLGRHRGIIRYTIGQRKGLGLSLSEPLYVCDKNPSDNTVMLCNNEDLFSTELDANSFNWIAFSEPPQKMHLKAKIRYNQKEQGATVTPTGSDTVHLVFDEPQRAITTGQAVVLYDGDVVIGGGTICRTFLV